MASGYEMTGPLWGVGKYVPEFGTEGENVVFLVGGNRVVLSPAKQDEFAHLYVAACHQAKANAEAVARPVTPGQPASCGYCEDDPDHPDPDNAGTCTCASPGCGRGWCPQRDDLAAMPGQVTP